MDPEANSFSKEAELLGSFLWFLLSTTLKVWRSCLAVLLPYMPNGEELVMQLVKECNAAPIIAVYSH